MSDKIKEIQEKIKQYTDILCKNYHLTQDDYDDNTFILDTETESLIKRVSLPVNLADSIKSKYFNKFLVIKGIVAGKDLLPYIIPKTFLFKCTKGDGAAPYKKCAFCPAYNAIGVTFDEREERKSDPIMLDFKDSKHRFIIVDIVKKTTEKQEALLKDNFSNVSCKFLTTKVLTTQVLEDINVIPEIDFEKFDDEYVVRQAYVLSESIKTNNIYSLYGVTIPNPKTQQAILVINKAEQTKDNIEEFVLDKETINKLKIFQPKDNETIKEKIRHIYTDLTNNVTKIYNRFEIIMAIDLVYYSVLQFNFLNDTIQKGWVEGLILGDTRTGKSKTAEKLMHHYKMGEMVSGENTTVAGLLAGVKQVGNNWSLMWGKIPLNDKRLLIIDETSGLEQEEISNLSSVRSSGIAEVTKIQIQKTYARTRLLWISNPRTKKINEYSYGVMAIKSLFGRQEDIARLDFAETVALEEVDDSVLNMRHDTNTPHIYTSELCNLLTKFAWSRRKEDIFISKPVEDYILIKANELSKKYSSIIPLVNNAEARIKIAKMSVALAVRLFSYDEAKKKVVVKKEHIDYIVNFLNYIYSKPSMGYDIYSEQRNKENMITDEDYLKEIIKTKEVVNILLDNNRFTTNDLVDIFGVEKKEAKEIAGKLIRMRAIKKSYSAYIKNPSFIKWLKSIKSKLPSNNEDDEVYEEDEIIF